MKRLSSILKKVIYCSIFIVHFGGEYVAEIVIQPSQSSMLIVCKNSLWNLRFHNTLDFIMLNVVFYDKSNSSMSTSSGCIVWDSVYLGIRQYLLFVKYISETNKMSMFWLKINVLIFCECLASPLAFQVIIIRYYIRYYFEFLDHYVIMVISVARLLNIASIFSIYSLTICCNSYNVLSYLLSYSAYYKLFRASRGHFSCHFC